MTDSYFRDSADITNENVLKECSGSLKMSNTIKERVAEVIKEAVRKGIDNQPFKLYNGDYEGFASDIDALYQAERKAENKTLTRLAADLDVPLDKAMKIAATVKAEVMKSGYHKVDEFYKK